MIWYLDRSCLRMHNNNQTGRYEQRWLDVHDPSMRRSSQGPRDILGYWISKMGWFEPTWRSRICMYLSGLIYTSRDPSITKTHYNKPPVRIDELIVMRAKFSWCTPSRLRITRKQLAYKDKLVPQSRFRKICTFLERHSLHTSTKSAIVSAIDLEMSWECCATTKH